MSTCGVILVEWSSLHSLDPSDQTKLFRTSKSHQTNLKEWKIRAKTFRDQLQRICKQKSIEVRFIDFESVAVPARYSVKPVQQVEVRQPIIRKNMKPKLAI